MSVPDHLRDVRLGALSAAIEAERDAIAAELAQQLTLAALGVSLDRDEAWKALYTDKHLEVLGSEHLPDVLLHLAGKAAVLIHRLAEWTETDPIELAQQLLGAEREGA